MRYEILLEKLFNGWDCYYNIRKTCGCAKPKKSNFKKLPILPLELTKTEWKKKKPICHHVFQSFSMFTCYCSSTSHFSFSKYTLSFSVFKFKLLVSAPVSLSITLSFKPHFATSTNR